MPTALMETAAEQPAELSAIGERVLREGKVAVLVAAGGMSTRLGAATLRGNVSIGPVTRRTIFELQARKISAVMRRYSIEAPVVVFTSAPVHQQVVRSLTRVDEAPALDFVSAPGYPVLNLAAMPVIDTDNGELLLAGGGHGELPRFLVASPVYATLRNVGVEHVFYFQYANVLEPICDPVFIGFHVARALQMSLKAIQDYRPDEPMGRLAEVDGRLVAVPHHLRDDSPFWSQRYPANTGAMLFSMDFLEKVAAVPNLPWYRVDHYVPESSYLLKAEQSILDALSFADRAGILVVSREEYAPVKYLDGAYSVASGAHALAETYRGWLLDAGARLDGSKCIIEIDPLFALDAAEVRERIAVGTEFPDGSVLQ